MQRGLHFLRTTVTIHPVLHVLSFLNANDMNTRSFFIVPWVSGVLFTLSIFPVYFLSVVQIGQLRGFFLLSPSILLLNTSTKLFILVIEFFSSKISIWFFFVYFFAEIFSFFHLFRMCSQSLTKALYNAWF